MSETNKPYWVYLFLVFAAGVAALIANPWATADFQSWPSTDILLWLVVVTVAAMSPIPLPRGSATINLTPAVDVGVLLLFGPAPACWYGVASRLFGASAQQWRPFGLNVMRTWRAPVVLAVSGWVYSAMGGRFGMDLEFSFPQLASLLALSITYLAVKRAIGAFQVPLKNNELDTIEWFQLFKANAAYDFVLFPFGALLALTHLQIGPIAVAFFLMPLLVARYAMKLWADNKRALVDTVRTLMYAVDAADPYTRGHSYRVSKMSVQVARFLRVPEEDVEEIEYAALLHDIGRTAIKRSILTKPGKLSDNEQAELRNHPRIARNILQNLRLFEDAAEIVYSHHEQPDGQGYPRGLAGHEIPIGSRIIMTVAAFDAMTSDRPYRRGLSPEAAFEELLAHSGTQFFPEIVEALIELYTHDALFEGFDEEELIQYGGEDSNSRALEAYLTKKRILAPIPDKRGIRGSGPEIDAPELDMEDDTKVIEFPAELQYARDQVKKNKQVALSEDGESLIKVSGLSDIGCVREKNEDSLGVFESEELSHGCLMVLADGMGGAAAGEVASRLAVDNVSSAFFNAVDCREVPDVLSQSLKSANLVINRTGVEDARMAGMATTCTAAVVVGDQVYIAHVGDSRAYFISSKGIRALTEDHTLAVELQRMSSSDSPAMSEAKNVLTRCLGAEKDVEVDLLDTFTLHDGERLLLASDGLFNQVTDEEIHDIAHQYDPEEACGKLVELARSRGGYDNISVMIGALETNTD
ncbi:MAG: HD domain-containing protein [Candidatus Eisenbacteria bacterium]|uniref:HD domain-containing protein n=1 Tax=Eiseniibacteriota bacterium TaxID=2212470 RepID=A0A7Y2H215_UNCEI|nr:HD domain-containing protein [Candidatus Eisenbacteria bacterium]